MSMLPSVLDVLIQSHPHSFTTLAGGQSGGLSEPRSGAWVMNTCLSELVCIINSSFLVQV